MFEMFMKIYASTDKMKQGFIIYYGKDDYGNFVCCGMKYTFNGNDKLIKNGIVHSWEFPYRLECTLADPKLESYKDAKNRAYIWLKKKGFWSV